VKHLQIEQQYSALMFVCHKLFEKYANKFISAIIIPMPLSLTAIEYFSPVVCTEWLIQQFF
jgi:hypothetical protein